MFTTAFAQLPLLLAIHATSWWRNLQLMGRLTVAASAAVVVVMACIASVVAHHIEEAAMHRAAAATALYMDSFVEPRIQELAGSSTLSRQNRDALESLLSPASIGRPVIAFRIWVGDRITFGSEHQLAGRTFPPSRARDWAWGGHISAELDSLDGDDDVQLRALNVPILEVYAPVRQTGSGRIIALTETYEIAVDLNRQIWLAQLGSWLVFGLVTLAAVSLLLGLQGRGARQMSLLHAENERIRVRVGEAHRRVSDLDEHHMRRVGTELYSGPVQMVALALLKFEGLRTLLSRKGVASTSHAEDLDAIHHALNEALGGIRDLSASLVPSQIEMLTLAQTVAMAARRHQRSTGTRVSCIGCEFPDDVPFSVRACVSRFVKEGLEALSKSACVEGRIVRATHLAQAIQIEVLGGPVPDTAHLATLEHELRNSRDRVEALGGVFAVRGDDQATAITARFADHGAGPGHG